MFNLISLSHYFLTWYYFLQNMRLMIKLKIHSWFLYLNLILLIAKSLNLPQKDVVLFRGLTPHLVLYCCCPYPQGCFWLVQQINSCFWLVLYCCWHSSCCPYYQGCFWLVQQINSCFWFVLYCCWHSSCCPYYQCCFWLVRLMKHHPGWLPWLMSL